MKFDAQFRKAALLRLIIEPHLITKFQDFITPDMFCISDEHKTVERIAKLVLDKARNHTVSVEAVFGWLQMSGADSAAREATIEAFKAMQYDENLFKSARTDEVFQTFLQFIKAQTFMNGHNIVKQKFGTGDFDGSYTQLEKTLGHLKSITLDEVENADWATSVKFMEDESNKTYNGFNLGLEDFDDNGGLEPQTLCMFLSTSGGGKSMMSMHLIRQAIKQGKHIYLCCVEDRKKSVLRRVYAAVTGLPIEAIKRYSEMAPEHRKLIKEAQGKLEKYVHIEFMYGVSPGFVFERIKEHLTRQKVAGKPAFDIVVVDYLQHIGHLAAGDAAHEKLHRAHADFKDFVLKHNLVGVTHFQVNRTGADKVGGNGLIDMSMVAGSYNSLFVADTIISINRSPDQRQRNEAILYILKGREGCAEHKYEVHTEFEKARFIMEDAKRIDKAP